MEYKIAIEELLRRVVTVEAENPTLAVYEVEEEYNLTRHVLSENDFIGVDIVLAPEDKEYRVGSRRQGGAGIFEQRHFPQFCRKTF